MSVAFLGGIITLTGECGVEEAETLLSLVQSNPAASVDISAAGPVHTALWQVLLVSGPRIIGQPQDPFIRRWVLPLLVSAT